MIKDLVPLTWKERSEFLIGYLGLKEQERNREKGGGEGRGGRGRAVEGAAGREREKKVG